MFKPGQKLKCINAKGQNLLIVGNIYTCTRMSFQDGEWFVVIGEFPEQWGGDGWYPWRFAVATDTKDFERFMERLLKPVDLGQPVTA
jgi:hypothetical protein